MEFSVMWFLALMALACHIKRLARNQVTPTPFWMILWPSALKSLLLASGLQETRRTLLESSII
ncbi:hypothetical protein KSP39_PZI001081 [Platanthera zijinensis]|uniref:Uncharacterized protein n=1 Tax=Platanthera zijinensis TaxID=2320716 RepID=A0AAP0GFX6_9ASPA